MSGEELIPGCQAHGFRREATMALLAGFGLMTVLDNALG